MTDAERQRLAAILGMLGSEHQGERDNAARLAEQLRSECGPSWAELLAERVVYVDREVVVERMVPIYTEPSPWIDRLLIIAVYGGIPLLLLTAARAFH